MTTTSQQIIKVIYSQNKARDKPFGRAPCNCCVALETEEDPWTDYLVAPLGASPPSATTPADGCSGTLKAKQPDDRPCMWHRTQARAMTRQRGVYQPFILGMQPVSLVVILSDAAVILDRPAIGLGHARLRSGCPARRVARIAHLQAGLRSTVRVRRQRVAHLVRHRSHPLNHACPTNTEQENEHGFVVVSPQVRGFRNGNGGGTRPSHRGGSGRR